jgi:hypothetical protein
LVKRKVRDIYGNWVWEDTDEIKTSETPGAGNDVYNKRKQSTDNQEPLRLEWRDFVALAIASLETFLLPIVIFIVVMFVLAVVLVHL